MKLRLHPDVIQISLCIWGVRFYRLSIKIIQLTSWTVNFLGFGKWWCAISFICAKDTIEETIRGLLILSGKHCANLANFDYEECFGVRNRFNMLNSCGLISRRGRVFSRVTTVSLITSSTLISLFLSTFNAATEITFMFSFPSYWFCSWAKEFGPLRHDFSSGGTLS